MTGKKSNGSDANDGVPHSSVSVRINWVRLLKRVFDIDIEHCLDHFHRVLIFSSSSDSRFFSYNFLHD